MGKGGVKNKARAIHARREAQRGALIESVIEQRITVFKSELREKVEGERETIFAEHKTHKNGRNQCTDCREVKGYNRAIDDILESV